MTFLSDWLNRLFITDTTAAHLVLAMLLGAAIGVERQLRQRSAGLRTTILVCIGAASFVDLSTAVAPNTMGVTQVIAYVVSGVGFLGAGAIMREGLNVRGLNTAATIWCSAAVGASSGVGEIYAAIYTATAVIFVNLMMRPVLHWLEQRRPVEAAAEETTMIRVSAVCPKDQAEMVRSQFLRGVENNGCRLTGLRSDDQDGGSNQVDVVADIVITGARVARIAERMVGSLTTEPAVTHVSWRIAAAPVPEV